MEDLACSVYKYRFLILVLFLLITVFFGFFLDIETDNTHEAWFSATDPEYVAWQEYLEAFGGGRYLIVALRSENIFCREILDYIKLKTEEIEILPQVDGVHSLANANMIRGTSEGIEFHPLMSDLSSDNIGKIKQYVLQDQIFQNYLISPDGKLTAIMIALFYLSSEEVHQTVQYIEELMRENLPGNVDLFISGGRKAMYELERFTKQTRTRLPFMIIVMVGVCTFIIYRSIYIVFMLLLNVGLSLCWALGFYSILGYTFNVITGILVPVVIVLSIADSVHIINYYLERKKEYTDKEAYVHTIGYISVPCFLTSVTTSLGFLSLSISSNSAIKHFGIGSAAGVFFAFWISIFFTPFLLTLTNVRINEKNNHLLVNCLRRLVDLNTTKYLTILVIALVALIAAGIGVSKVRIETNQLDWFPRQGNFYRSTKVIESDLSGTYSLELILSGQENDFKNPDILRRVDNLANEISGLSHVKKVVTLCDYLKKVNKALHDDRSEFYCIPNDQFLIAQEFFLLTLSDEGREEIIRLTTPDFSQSNVSVRTESLPVDESIGLANRIETIAAQAFEGTSIRASLTGNLYLTNIMQKYLQESQIKGFSLAFITIMGLLFIAFRSVKFGALSILPNVLPITVILGTMGWFHFYLNTATIMVASIALGLAVDDTIHFICRFRSEIGIAELSIQKVLEKTIMSTGNSISYTSFINIAGFSILIISQVRPVREFGLLMSLVLLLALAGDLVVLPSSIMLFRRLIQTRKNVVKAD